MMIEGTEEAEDDPDCFFRSLRPLFLLGQVCGVLPVKGIFGKRHSYLKFSRKSWHFMYILTILLSEVCLNCIFTYESMQDGIRLDNFGNTIFYTVCILNIIFFIDIGRDLPALCGRVAKIEASILEYGYPAGMKGKVKNFIVIFVILATMEHLLLVYLNVIEAIEELEHQDISFLESLYRERFSILYRYTGYNPVLTFFIFFINIISTLNWNYLDFFLAVISMQISGKFSQINIAIEACSSKYNGDVFSWEQLCMNYNKLSVLTKIIERKISKLVFMSYLSNMYHLSLQLLRVLSFKGSSMATSYVYFSMGYLFLRMLAVSLCGAQIVEQSKASMNFLFSIRTPCASSARLLEQIRTDDIHISGNKFFIVDKRFVVSILCTLVTYEVILFQLDSLHFNDAVD